MATTVEDVLSRRMRALILDADAATSAAPRVAELLAAGFGWDQARIDSEVARFTSLAASTVSMLGETSPPSEPSVPVVPLPPEGSR